MAYPILFNNCWPVKNHLLVEVFLPTDLPETTKITRLKLDPTSNQDQPEKAVVVVLKNAASSAPNVS